MGFAPFVLLLALFVLALMLFGLGKSLVNGVRDRKTMHVMNKSFDRVRQPIPYWLIQGYLAFAVTIVLLCLYVVIVALTSQFSE
jgi:SNF family Na+-dependent transporter